MSGPPIRAPVDPAQETTDSPSSSSTTRSPSPTLPRASRGSRQRSFSPDRRPWPERSWTYQYRPFRGMWDDVRRRAPFYLSDWTEGLIPRNWERVTGATIRMYFLNLFPALAYIVDMNVRTGGNYGVNECILASAIAALTFSILSVQPLTIVGVTGLINLFNYTAYDILKGTDVNYLQFQAWSLIWSAISHWLIAILNISDFTRFITDMTSTTFGLYVGVIYIQKGVELLVLEFDVSGQAGWFSVVVATLFALFVYFLERTATLPFGPFWMRKFIQDYAFAAGIILFTGFVHIPGEIKSANIEFLEITRSFYPSTDRNWVVPFWELPVRWIFASLPFGLLITLLFYFDNNVSAVMAQARSFPVKRPAGFHWDFFLLGCTTFVAGILGLPAPNGLVPQAPVHTEALCVTKMVPEETVLSAGEYYEKSLDGEEDEGELEKRSGRMKVVRTRLVEQRMSHLVMGLLTLGTMSRPLLVVLGLMSKAMFAGIFLVVGWGSVEGNPIVHKTLFLLRDPNLTPRDHPLHGVRKSSIAKFVGIQWLFFAMIIAVSETLAGIGFPVIITLLIPLRHFYVPRLFTPEELLVLDAPTANSAAVLVSLGGPLQPEHGSERRSGLHADQDIEEGCRAQEGADGLRRRGRAREQEEGVGEVGEPKVVEDGLQKTTSIKR
ncbi:HCO3 transporter family-domain-containing protein [Leucosporidium creatinivorum]|uniref:HCO3 transporter family-domain-containing protein n=1 Tax=Leucosporidium creatinivorum TaxID=106004 RepID=A0A1Y2G0G0_9BASI|nr:HCO3 transporter family-domain-containing protein [Leucosporidium creatinivorum]